MANLRYLPFFTNLLNDKGGLPCQRAAAKVFFTEVQMEMLEGNVVKPKALTYKNTRLETGRAVDYHQA